jgi:hypothetical protein
MQTEAPEEVLEWIDDVRESISDAFKAIAEGDAQ